MKFQAVLISVLILLSLFPLYLLTKYLQRIMKPRNSLARLFSYIFAVFVLVFIYTFLLVAFVKTVFPSA